MMRAGLLNFSKGVLAPQLLGRTDVAAYNAGLKRGDNIRVLKHGGFTIRPGFRVVSEVIAAGERLFAFRFSDDQTYALAFGQAYMQPLSGGGVVLEDELQISGATNANPMVLTAAYHGFATGDRVFVTGVAGALGGFLNGRIWTVGAVTTSTFEINLNGVSLPVFTGSTGGILRTMAPTPPPAPPPVPPPYVPPDPPPVYSGGGGGGEVVPGAQPSFDRGILGVEAIP